MIIVTGVHRSGTSAVAMTMEALGVDFGAHNHFYEPDRWNPRGYFERTDVIDINSRVLTGFRRTQGRLSAGLSQVRYLTGTSPRSVARRAEQYRSQIAELAAELGPIAVKDPRFCLTMDAWRPFAESVVVSLRHPMSVARSLHRRQRVPYRLALKFWNRHAEGLLRQPADSTLYVDFDSLAGENAHEEVRRLVAFLRLDVGPTDASRALQSRIAPDLRHFDTRHVSRLPAHTQDLWSRLSARR